MPSWIWEHDGLEWYDERFTVGETNQSPQQLEKKVRAGKVRVLTDRTGARWYARPDVEKLRAAFLKRREAAKKWRPSNAQIETRYTRQWQADIDREKRFRALEGPFAGSLHRGPLTEHAERVMLWEIAAANKKHENDTDAD